MHYVPRIPARIVTATGGIKLLLGYLRRKGYNARHILIVGSGAKVRNFVDLIRRHAAWGPVISGVVSFCGESSGEDIKGCPNLGDMDDLAEICKQHQIDEVVFSLPPQDLGAVDGYLGVLQEMGITVRMVIDLYDAPTSYKELSLFHDDIPMLTYHSIRHIEQWSLLLDIKLFFKTIRAVVASREAR